MATTVRISDIHSKLDRVIAQLTALKRTEITIGVHGGGVTGKDERGKPETTPQKHEGTQMTMAHLATIHEFGTANIPERSFIRAGIDKGTPQLEKALNLGINRICEGTGDAVDAANLIGVIAVSQIKKVIADGISPSLAASTKKQRDKSKVTGKRLASGNASSTGYTPLRDSGQLIQSIVYKASAKGSNAAS